MTAELALARRFQFSVRSILIGTAVLASLLVPVTWVTHQREQMRRAREEAIRAVILAERYRSEIQGRKPTATPSVVPGATRDPSVPSPSLPPEDSALIERLQRENSELKDTVELLRREVERLKALAR